MDDIDAVVTVKSIQNTNSAKNAACCGEMMLVIP